MNVVFRLGLLGCLAGLLFLALGGCESKVMPFEGAVINETANPKEHIGVSNSVLEANDTRRSDSIASLLVPMLLTDPISRDLENWYNQSQRWKNVFGDVDKLLNYSALVFDNFQKKNDLVSAARVKNSIGRIHYLRGNYSQAIAEMQESLNLAREAGDSISVGWALSGFVNPYAQSRDLDMSYHYIQEGLALAKATKHIGLQCFNKLNEAVYYGYRANFDTATLIMQEVIAIANENNFESAKIFAQLNSGVFLTYSEKYNEAIALLKEDFGLDGTSYTVPNAVLNYNLYEAYFGKKEYALALESLTQGCRLSDSLDFGFGISFCAKSLSQYHEATGNFAMALQYNKEYQKIKEIQVGEEVKRKIQSLENRQIITEKDFQIERLQAAELEQQAAFKTRRNLLLYLILGLLLLSVASFAIVQSRYRVKSAYQSKTIAETKLQVLQAQMNPHFIYNAMTGIQNYILKSEKIEAYSYLGKFADLLRMITKSSQDTRIRLDNEVEMISTYLDLEKLRFREAFIYNITVAEDLLAYNPEVPSMMVQPVVENAIIHGLSGLDKQGILSISYEKYQEGIKCTVTDNGRGRIAATEIAQQESNLHLSIASINIRQRLKFLREIGYTSARTKVEDLYEDGVPSGTAVYIYLPILSEKTTLT